MTGALRSTLCARAPVLCALAVAAACGGAPPQVPWLEQELGSSHEERDSTPAGADGDRPAATSPTESTASTGALAAVHVALEELDRGASPVVLERALTALPASSWPALEALAAAEPERLATAYLSAALARRWLHARAPERAALQVQRAKALAAGAPALARELAELEAALPAFSPLAPRKVAVLLPLSGRFSAIGRELARAIELAPPGLTWQLFDTKGEPAQAAAQVDQAIAAGAAAILGPVGEREAIAAARRAGERGIAMALLAPQEGASAALGILRLASSVEDEARAVAEWALANDHLSVAVLSPRDDVGRAAAAAFTARAEALGLTVAARGEIDAAGGELEADIKALLGLVPARNPRLAAHLARGGKRAWQTFVPEVPFSLLYVPDRGERGALVAAYLPYFGVELRTEEIMDPLRLKRKYRGAIPQVVQLVGGGGWASPTFPARGGPAVQGAMVFDLCAAQRDDVADEAFARLATALGRAPSTAAASALDAATFLVTALTALPARTDREAIRRQLLATELELGACGPLAIDARGEAVRQPVVMQIDGEDLVLAP